MEALSQIHPKRPKAQRDLSGLKPAFDVFIRLKTRLRGFLKETPGNRDL